MLALLLIVNGLIPNDGDTRLAAVASLDAHCSAVLVSPQVALTARHCLPVQRLTFTGGAVAEVAGVYQPQGGDAALLSLAAAVEGVDPIRMSLSGAEAGVAVTLAGWGGKERALRECSSVVIWSDADSYIQFPRWNVASGPGCGPESGDSGGGVIVGGRALRVVGVITGTGDATNLERYRDDQRFLEVSQW